MEVELVLAAIERRVHHDRIKTRIGRDLQEIGGHDVMALGAGLLGAACIILNAGHGNRRAPALILGVLVPRGEFVHDPAITAGRLKDAWTGLELDHEEASTFDPGADLGSVTRVGARVG